MARARSRTQKGWRADHVALPFKVGFSRVQKIVTAHGLHERIGFIGSGKLGFPEATVFACALGCDAVSVGREAGYGRGFGLPSATDCDEVRRLMSV